MNRNEMLRRQQGQRSQRAGSGIPGWLWGIGIGALGALVAVGVVMRSTASRNEGIADPVSETVATAPAPNHVPQTPQPEFPAVTIAPSEPMAEKKVSASRDEEIEKMRQQIDDLRRQSEQSKPAQAAEPEYTEPTQPIQEQQVTARQSALEQSAQAEVGWRPVLTDFQKRYSEKKGELDKLIDTLKQMEAQCNYTQMGEPTEAQKRRGVRDRKSVV